MSDGRHNTPLLLDQSGKAYRVLAALVCNRHHTVELQLCR
jgi:hypothetical protein